jgi:hypothetical protein
LATEEWRVALRSPALRVAVGRHNVSCDDTLQKNAGTLRLRPDQKLVYLRNWEDEKVRLKGGAGLMQALVQLARAGQPEAPPAPMPKPTPELVKT